MTQVYYTVEQLQSMSLDELELLRTAYPYAYDGNHRLIGLLTMPGRSNIVYRVKGFSSINEKDHIITFRNTPYE